LQFFQLAGGTFIRVRDQFHAPNLLGGDHRLHALLPKQHVVPCDEAFGSDKEIWIS